MCADALVSLNRLQKYLGLQESEAITPPGLFGKEARHRPPPVPDVVASISDGSFHFAPLGEGEVPFLRNLSLTLRKGTLTVVCGTVGSGKTALASALLGDLISCSDSGRLRVSGRVAYVSQTPWIQSSASIARSSSSHPSALLLSRTPPFSDAAGECAVW